MAARIDPLMTVADLDCMPEDGNRYEVIEGELFVSRAPGLTHQQIATNIVIDLGTYLAQSPLGRVVATPGLIFSGLSGVIPDIVFFSYEREQAIVSGERLTAAPELVIEILSPGDANESRDRIAKRQLYGKYGVEEYWIVDSKKRTIEIYRLAAGNLELISMLRDDGQLTSPLFPGLSCVVSQLFRH
jgi:Uma2 family endonuclease